MLFSKTSIDFIENSAEIIVMSATSLLQVLDKYRQVSFSLRNQGMRFEQLMKAYLQTDPTYANYFQKVWLWEEFPSRADFFWGGGEI